MPTKPKDELTALFRSLGPSDTGMRTSAASLAREAEERWPLLKAIAPRRVAATPALSDEEKLRWTEEQTSAAAAKKPALSLPGLSDKMSKGLGKMANRALPMTPSAHVEQESPLTALIERQLPPLAERTGLGRDTPSAQFNQQALNTQKSRPGLFQNQSDGSGPKEQQHVSPPAFERASVFEESAAMPSDDSLLAVFSRLSMDAAATKPVAAKKPSFLSRLGKR